MQTVHADTTTPSRLEAAALLGDGLELGKAGENCSEQAVFRDNTSPAGFVTAIAGHENLSGSVKTVLDTVERTVVVRVDVTVLVMVV